MALAEDPDFMDAIPGPVSRDGDVLWVAAEGTHAGIHSTAVPDSVTVGVEVPMALKEPCVWMDRIDKERLNEEGRVELSSSSSYSETCLFVFEPLNKKKYHTTVNGRQYIWPDRLRPATPTINNPRMKATQPTILPLSSYSRNETLDWFIRQILFSFNKNV